MQTNLLNQFGENSYTRVLKAVSLLKQGKGVLLVDDEDRENEGDIIFSAESMTDEKMNMLIRNCSGIVCLCLDKHQQEKLNLPYMVNPNKNNSRYGTAFTVSIEAAKGVTTGVSASDRVTTIKAAINSDAKPEDLARPGHVFPITANPNGVLSRAGHTEGSVDLMKIANLKPAAVLCELMNPDGTMSRLPQVCEFALANDTIVLSVQDIVNYRRESEGLLKAS